MPCPSNPDGLTGEHLREGTDGARYGRSEVTCHQVGYLCAEFPADAVVERGVLAGPYPAEPRFGGGDLEAGKGSGDAFRCH
ncbi:hypothetical protein GCM10010339_47340 [Streptomyces alanosinicus]|uniref:Uncharacterized protein n=1 Tax=Streptomyces alanosinicus TaxID=68171 RepID=A0A918YKR5_9ACTN|nr:hypothetical protein GCM10010339_47340 [Streptomyces alanosinicus]